MNEPSELPPPEKKKKNNFTEMENGADKDEGQSRRRHKEAAPRNECQTTTGGRSKNGEKCEWWFV